MEHANAGNLLGAALLHTGRLDEAVDALEQAAATFERHRQPLELGAARFNLGLVLRRRGEAARAADAFADALACFEEGGAAAQATAAARELGGARLELGPPADATRTLERALELAKSSGDRASLGAAANLLGLARLGTGEPAAAAEALRLAASAYPRQLDAANHAMATANLALAHEQLGDLPRARLAAWRAAQVPAAPAPVAAQARAILDRLGRPGRDLVVVLEREPPSAWASELAANVTALSDAGPAERERLLGHWITGQLDSPHQGAELAAALLEVLLELPPEDLDTVVRALLRALRHTETAAAERFRSQTVRAFARFHLPQWQRLQTVFAQIAAEVGDTGAWS